MAECANPLLLEWVGEWLEKAKEHNSKGVSTYKNAYKSLQSCTIAFDHPSQVQQLQGFGEKMCERLTLKMKEYCEQNGLPMPQKPNRRKRSKNSSGANEEGDEEENAGEEKPSPAKKVRKLKAYVPALRSGAYGLVLALATLEEDAPAGLTKAETIALAQPHCDASYTAPSDPTKFYTSWSSMKTLVDKDYVYERGRPSRRYALTEEGWEVAKRIKKTDGTNKNNLDEFPEGIRLDLNSNESSCIFREGSRPAGAPSCPESSETATISDVIPAGISSALPTFEPLILEPGAFSVRLVLDSREIRAKQDRDYIQNELAKKEVNPIVRALSVGDVLWVAKLHNPQLLSTLGAEGDEIMLDWIVERKRLDDLIGSIKDGRFHEQKFRLQKSGVKNVIYLIEEISMQAESFQRYEEAVQSAIASSQVVNGYFVKKTQKVDDTIRYLARMTMMLKDIYENKPLKVIPTNVITTQNYRPLLEDLSVKEAGTNYHISYPAFASLASKSETTTLRDVFLRMLMCVKGITGEKAIEIQRRWKTPNEFIEAYERCGSGDQGRKKKMEMVSAETNSLIGRKKIGKALSIKIAEVWGCMTLEVNE
jgi:crossover junction endonuclease MUS81